MEVLFGGSWQTGAMSLSKPRYAHCSVRISEEEILVLGGGSSDGRLSSAELLNIVEGTSTLFESMTMPTIFFGCSFSQSENRVYVSGGWGTSSLVEYLDNAT